MAEAAVSMAVEKLGDLLIQKVGFLIGVEEQIQSLKNELRRMQCFLKDATEKQSNNEMVRNWVAEIRDLAQDAEDVIETFNLKIETPRRTRGLLTKCACFPEHVYHLDSLGQEIESIRARLRGIFESREGYGIRDLGPHEGTESRRSNFAVESRRLVPQRTDKDVVGLEKDIESLLGKAILKESPGLLISRITGMGGLGKSTLAREVYNQSGVIARFDFRAWVVVSEEFDPKGVIKQLLLKLVERPSNMEELSLEELEGMLFQHLENKEYFIVLDDVWEQQHWESLAQAFPDKRDKRSRLLVTSRNRNVPRNAQHAHELKPLDPDRSWQLFLKKSFIDDTKGKCPPHLADIGKEIVSKCGGLPLAITVMGGLLLEQRQSRTGWEKVLKGINSQLGRSENRVTAVLELSYNELSPHLKSCFLCLGFFKEDAIIRAEKLIQVWIAEGLISQEREELETMEETARGYLDELINRNIVQVKHVRKNDQVKNCQIHDLIRELSIKKAEEEIGFKISREGINSQASDKCRHYALYCSTERFNFSVISNNKRVRSLFFHTVEYAEIKEIPSLNFKSFTLLRALDFEGFGLWTLPKTIGELTGLKYLGLRNNKLSELPRSMGRLKSLQVLDITKNFYLKVPNVIWKMYSLRHLYMDDTIMIPPLRLDTLKNLQTLIYFPRNCKWFPKHLKEMTDLRKLNVCIDNSVSDVREFITSFSKMKNLSCLKLRLSSNDIPLEGLDTLHSVTELRLKYDLPALPSYDHFPPNLSHLTLDTTHLREDPMPVLEKLPNLLYLNLKQRAYDGTEMVISDYGFPRLRVLLVECMVYLRKIESVGGGHGIFPELKRFEISRCYELESLPSKLMALLQGIRIFGCPKLEN